MILPSPTWFVGCGNMVGAMIDGWKAARVDMSSAVVIRPSGTPVDGIKTVTQAKDAGAAPKMVVLGFKPQQLDAVVPDLLPWMTSKTVIVSLLAGAELASLRKRFPKGVIVRTLPNLAVAVRRGIVPLHSQQDLGEALLKQLSDLFSALGFAMWTQSETVLETIGSVAGSGPAYVARFVDALAGAGVKMGLPDELAATIARETTLGTTWMAASSGETMDALARRVASPNGTTEAGLAVLDKDGAMNHLVDETIEAAAKRGRSLAEAARLP